MRDERSGGHWPQVERPEGDGGHGTAQETVEPDGYVYDAQGYAYPVYGGYVWDGQGQWIPLDEFAPGGQVETAAPADAEQVRYFDRYQQVDPAQWGFDGTDTGELFTAGSRAERREARKGNRRRRSGIALTIALALVVASGWFVWNKVLPEFFGGEPEVVAEADDYPGPGTGAVEVSIPAGATGTAIAQLLVEADVVQSTTAFMRAHAANPDAVGIQPGTYRLHQQMKAEDAVLALLDRGNRVELRVTIPEGFRVEQILDRFAAVTSLPREEFEAAIAYPVELGVPEDLVRDLDNPAQVVEGWLFPDTYVIEPSESAVDMLSRMVAQMKSVLEDLDVAQDDWEETLIRASLIEREIKLDDDRPKASRAIANRTERGMPLDIDATVAYGLGISGTELTQAHLQDESNAFNTYRHVGLPPGAIASPGRASIEAALNPEDGPWLFWVTVNLDTGETKFAETYAEHEQNVAELRAWQAEQEQASTEAEEPESDG